jgi:hypothetical protein
MKLNPDGTVRVFCFPESIILGSKLAFNNEEETGYADHTSTVIFFGCFWRW